MYYNDYYDYGINVRPINHNNDIGYNAVLEVVFSEENEVEPVTLQEAKDWCRIDVTDDDSLIASLISGARNICELHSNISFITRTVKATLNNGLGRIRLPYTPLIGDVVFTDEDGNPKTDDDGNPFSLRLPSSCVVVATYNAGYSTLPPNLKTALLNQVVWMYENRGDQAIASKLSEQAKLILNQVRRVD